MDLAWVFAVIILSLTLRVGLRNSISNNLLQANFANHLASFPLRKGRFGEISLGEWYEMKVCGKIRR